MKRSLLRLVQRELNLDSLDCPALGYLLNWLSHQDHSGNFFCFQFIYFLSWHILLHFLLICYVKCIHVWLLGVLSLVTGITCLFIAAKVEEIYPPKIAEFAFVTDGACSENEILDMELVILKVSCFYLHSELTINEFQKFLLCPESIFVFCSPTQFLLNCSQCHLVLAVWYVASYFPLYSERLIILSTATICVEVWQNCIVIWGRCWKNIK